MAIGRITGPLLKANLLRDGVDLAFENDLLYLDVINGRIGINTATPSTDLQVDGTTRTTNLEVTTQATIGTTGSLFTISGNTIASDNSIIQLVPSGTNAVVYQGKLVVDNNLQITTNAISTTVTDANLEFNTSGTGQVNVNSNMLVTGDLHATGTITADGDIQLGDANTDNVVFNADVNSNIIPNNPLGVPIYDLGSDPSTGGKAWATAYLQDVQATNIVANSIVANGISLELPQGNIIYVATTGDNANAGLHQNDPVLTIARALELATSGTTVYIYPGTYTEVFPLTVPVGVTVKGSGLRAVTVQPTVGTIDKDAFLLNGETTVEDLTVTGFRFNVANDTGYAFRFANNFTVTTRSPYVKNITVITRGSVVSAGDPYGFDQNDAGKGVLVDGSVANALSNEAAMLFHSVTFFTPNQETVVATNGVRIEWLNSFSYFAEKGFYAYSSAAGFAGQGKTRLRINTRIGTWAVGNTVSYYDTDGTTVLASGTIASIEGDNINLSGRQLGFETITDRVGKTVFAQGDAKLSTTQKKFGTTSLALDGVGDYISVASQPDFDFGTNDFCLELWVYPTSTGAYRTLFDTRTATPSDGGGIVLGITDANQLYFYYNFGFRVGPVGTISQNTWTHIALSKVSGNTRAFINGTQVGSTYVDTNSYAARPVRVGADPAGNFAFTGYIDDVRISKGVARYTTTFVPPVAALTGDLNTVLLLNLNGANNSTTILDNGITLQDLRTSAGGTASLINFADYSDFGAEIRSIGSASVYGTYGVYGDGVGVIGYFISHNVAYIGAGKSVTNDPNDMVPAQEFVQLNGAKIYRTAVDNEGNFTVGTNFSINQKTGEVLFNSQNAVVNSLSGVTFTDGVNTTTITSTDITTGNIRIYDNNIDSLTGPITVTAANGEINLQNNTFVTGNLNVTGDVNIGGNITIGDQTSDTVSFVASIDSDLIPATTAFYDLGTTALRWGTAFLNRAEIDNLTIDNNTIQTTNANDDLQLIAAGTGRIYIPSNNVQIDQNLTVTTDLTVTTGTSFLKNTSVTGTITQTGNINQTGDFVTSGNTQVTGNITASGVLQLPQIEITGNTVQTRVSGTDLNLVANGTGNVVVEGIMFNNNNIQSVATNSNITLVPQGTGGVVVNSNQSVQIPVGNTSQRPGVGVVANGMIRYNTDLTQYEGYNNGFWVKLGGLQDIDGNTKILAEATPGANDNTLYFYANNNLTATIDSTKLFTQRFQTINLDVVNNTISPITSNSDLVLSTTGTGGVRAGNFKIFNNSITNVVSNAITEFVQSGTGYVKIGGVSGVVIPSGDTQTQRPPVPVSGMMRFNTDLKYVEIYNGTTWTSVAGASGGVTTNEANEIGILSALLFG
jgi:hypothetical protein